MTWTDLALAAGATTDDEADFLLWSATAFPFAKPRTVWYQLRHAVRHKICTDNPAATCCSRKAFRVQRPTPNT